MPTPPHQVWSCVRAPLFGACLTRTENKRKIMNYPPKRSLRRTQPPRYANFGDSVTRNCRQSGGGGCGLRVGICAPLSIRGHATMSRMMRMAGGWWLVWLVYNCQHRFMTSDCATATRIVATVRDCVGGRHGRHGRRTHRIIIIYAAVRVCVSLSLTPLS